MVHFFAASRQHQCAAENERIAQLAVHDNFKLLNYVIIDFMFCTIKLLCKYNNYFEDIFIYFKVYMLNNHIVSTIMPFEKLHHEHLPNI